MKKSVFLLLFIVSLFKVYPQQVDSIIDIRDNQIYKVIKIGQQWWMQENLNTGTRINGSQDATDNGIIQKYCYNDLESNCDVYGGLYQWNEMMKYSPSDSGNPGNTLGICPVGWHLPTDNEWTELINYLGGESDAGGKLKEVGTIYWKNPNTGASNESGFTGLPGGYRLSIAIGSFFYSIGTNANFWSSTESGNPYYRSLTSNSSEIGSSLFPKESGFSVRCLIDTDQFGYLIISDKNFEKVSYLNFYNDNILEKLILVNSGVGKDINISSIYTKNSVYNLNKSSSTLSPGDTIHLTITFNPPAKDFYPDTLIIKSNDPYDSLITILLNGTFPLEISFTDSTNISCFGYSDGTATVTPSLGIPPYQYQWDDPENTKDSTVRGLKANIYYHITVTDNLGWTVTDSIILSEPDQLEINPLYSDTICLNSSDGFISTNPSGGTPPYNFIWSNDATIKELTGLESGYYSVMVTDSRGCKDSASFTIYPAIPFHNEQICIVTIDLVSGKNIIVWEKTPNVSISAYNIYRESSIGVYDKIGTIPVNELSIFKDTTANPESRAYLYKITAVDTCENESLLTDSKYHRPSFLQYVSSTGGVNLEWTDYSIEGVTNIGDYLTSYAIYRGTDSTGLTEYEVVGSITNYTDTDLDALARKYYYRVAAIMKDPCIPTSGKKADTGPYSHSMSNLEDNRFQEPGEGVPDVIKNDFKIIPNPLNEAAILRFNNPGGHAYTLYIMDISGKRYRIVDNITTSEYVLEKGGLQEGFYFIELRGPEVFRGKMVIE